MHAIEITEPGGPDVLRWTEVADPTPRPDEVLIDVAASAVNRADVLQRKGMYPPPPGASDIPGLECSGTIAAVGDAVTGWSVGDHVCALLAGGGYAEKVAVPAGQVLPVPAGVDLVDAASLPEVACTVWSNIEMTAHLGAGQTFLVHGGGGGIGTHAIQVAKALGATVVATASAGKLDRCRALGADVVVDYASEDFVEVVRERFGGADVILDNMGAKYLNRNIEALAPDGRLVVIGMQGGAKGELNLGALLAKRGGVFATGLRGRPDHGPQGKPAVVEAVRENVWPMIADGRVVPVVAAHVPMPDAGRAQTLLDDRDTVGKVVLDAP